MGSRQPGRELAQRLRRCKLLFWSSRAAFSRDGIRPRRSCLSAFHRFAACIIFASAPVAQLDRANASGALGREFESLRARQRPASLSHRLEILRSAQDFACGLPLGFASLTPAKRLKFESLRARQHSHSSLPAATPPRLGAFIYFGVTPFVQLKAVDYPGVACGWQGTQGRPAAPAVIRAYYCTGAPSLSLLGSRS